MKEVLQYLLSRFPGRKPSWRAMESLDWERKQKIKRLEVKEYEDPQLYRITAIYQWEPYYIGATFLIRVTDKMIFMANVE
jgi:hypothetical protein